MGMIYNGTSKSLIVTLMTLTELFDKVDFD